MQALGRSRGGYSCKIHISVDALGNPLEFILSPGEASDCPLGPRLVGEDIRIMCWPIAAMTPIAIWKQ